MVDMIAALNRFDPDQRVSAHAGAGHRSRGEIDGDAAGRIGVDGTVDAGQADDRVVAIAAHEHIVAGSAGQRVVVDIAVDYARDSRS